MAGLRRSALAKAQREADEWNDQHLIGTTVRYWTGIREGEGRLSKTRSSWAALPSCGSRRRRVVLR